MDDHIVSLWFWRILGLWVKVIIFLNILFLFFNWSITALQCCISFCCTTMWLSYKYTYTPSGEGNGNPLQYSCLENPMDGGAWWAVVHGVARVGHDWATSLSLFTHTLEKEMATHSSVLAWIIPGMGKPVGLLSVGSHRVGHDWSDLAAVAVAYPLLLEPPSHHSLILSL